MTATNNEGRAANPKQRELGIVELGAVNGGKGCQSDVSARYSQVKDNIVQNFRA